MPKASTQQEPIAIIGIGCRFPGDSNSPEAFWKMMCAGTDAITEIPADRWNTKTFYDPVPQRPGKSITKWGGFIRDIDKFDPEVFNISPREADWMDPQQRILLEASWEALEDGRQNIDRLRGSNTGVFLGVSTTDYFFLQYAIGERPRTDVYTATGGAISIAANRVSYCFDFQGPSMAMDTACSSALTAVHTACQSLWQGSCTMALAAGVNALLSPSAYMAFSRMGMLSPTGRCQAFDASANGFVRSEGVGAILLKPLSAAQAAGDKIYAVIRSTAANQDGRTNGITVPSPVAQEALVRAACQSAGILPREIQYIEAHGTGTPVGDPIEAHALGSALGDGRSSEVPCIMGSVKTNIGHLESAAGIAGIIKLALVLKKGQIPPNIHFNKPNPYIDFDKLKLRVIKELEDFPSNGRMLGGVNSFGFGGANAHAILEAAPAAKPKKISRPKDKTHILPLSARSHGALQALTKEYQQLLANGVDLHELCAATACRRTALSNRMYAIGDSAKEISEKLTAFLAGEGSPGLVAGTASSDPQKQPVFVFSGQGPQWWGMGRQLLAEEALFRAKIEECDRYFREFGDWSLLKELGRDEKMTRLDDTAIAQPAIFAIQVSLAALWQSWGVKPSAVIGHSVGEVAAAHVAGVLTLREAARVIFHRGRSMDQAPARGRMLAVGLDAKQAEDLIAPYPDRVTIAAYNSPVSVTLSGEGTALEEISKALEKRHVFNRFLQVKYAFHSNQMDPVKADLLKSLGKVELSKAILPMISTVTGKLTEGLDLDADYWWRNVRQPVRFSEAATLLIGQGSHVFLELSSHPALGVSLNECFTKAGVTGTVQASLRRHEKDRLTLMENLAGLHLAGVSLDWTAFYPDSQVEFPLPFYPWQRERYWSEPPTSRETRLGNIPHPLLLRPMQTSTPTWMTWLDQDMIPWLKDHRVQTHIVFPGAGYVESALAMGRAILGNMPLSLEELDLQKAIFLPENRDVVYYQASYNPADYKIKLSSRVESAVEWTTNVVGKLRVMPDVPEPVPVNVEEVKRRCNTSPMEPAQIYEMYDTIGFSYGPQFRGVQKIWRRDNECLGLITLPEPLVASMDDYQIHPVLLDSCFQTYSFSVPEKNPLASLLLMPVFLERLKYYRKPTRTIWCHAKINRIGNRFCTWDFQIIDDQGNLVMQIENFRSQCIAGNVATRPDHPDNWFYQPEWKRKPLGKSVARAQSATYIGATPALAAAAAEATKARLPEVPAAVSIDKLAAGLDSLATLYILQSLEKLGAKLKPGQKISVPALAKKLKIPSSRQILFGRLVHLLTGPELTVRRLPAQREPGALWAKLLRQFPAAYPELTLLLRCGEAIDRILIGKAEAADFISPGGSNTLLEHLYQDAPTQQGANHAVAQTVEIALKNLPRDRATRILEIGGGTGGLTSYILPKLPADKTDYTFSDANEALLNKAEQKFFDYSFVKCQKFDLDVPPQEQTLDLGAFDIVIVSDTLRASVNPRLALMHLQRMLTPDGLLIVNERLRTTAWHEFIFAGQWKQPVFDRAQVTKWLGDAQLIEVSALKVPVEISANGMEIVMARSASAQNHPEPLQMAEPMAAKPGSWLIFADKSGFATELSGLLEKRGDQVMLVEQGPSFRKVTPDRFIASNSAEDQLALLTELGAKNNSGIIYLRGLDFVDNEAIDLDQLAATEANGCHALLHLVQSLTKADALKNPRLWIVTRGAQAMHANDPVSVAQGPLIGMGRAIQNEYRHLRCTLIDLTPGGAETDARSLLQQLIAEETETEIAFRGPIRQVSRIMRTNHDQHVEQPKGRIPYRLEITNPGVIDELRFRELPRRKPGPDEIEIEICAAALNFRDVLKALGLYPIESDLDLLLGDECSGRVVAVGRKVKDFKVGDEVIASALGCFASHVTVPALCAVKKPARITFEEAVTIPVTFMTAWYALVQLGQIKKGEKILIQAGTGGVGLAAIQIAQHFGAEVFATAGNPEKRDFLRAMGVAHVMDSRTLAFADEIKTITNGRGVDLVLNSLAAHAIEKGISVLAPQGRYLEIGKRDIYADTHVGLRPFRNNLSMFVIDMAQVVLCEPTRIRALFKPIMELIAAGKLNPLPHRSLPVSRATNAFRLMAQARHIGKIVLSMQNDSITARRVAKKHFFGLPAKASYLITGGLGGFGLAFAKWMIENGAKNLVLTGRRGAATPAAKKAVADLKRMGATVTVIKNDVTKKDDVQKLFKAIAQKCPPLKGIFHTAMVLDDGILAQLTPERFQPVLAPKIQGTWNLHEASLNLKLDHFVLFSSISSLVGAAGQGNYVCGNSFLDSMAHYRRSRGLPALTVNWGAIAEVGFVARNAHVEQHLTSHGVVGINPLIATGTLGRFMQGNATQIAFMHVDWQKFAGGNPNAIPPRYSELIQASGQENTDGAAEIRKAILAAAPGKRLALVAAQIREPVAKVLRTSAAKLDVDRPLKEMGLDSLMAVELLNRIEVRFGVSLPPGKLTAGGTITSIAGIVLELIAGESATEVELGEEESAATLDDLGFDRLNVFRQEGGRAPLFLIHPAGGFTALYERLVEQLPADMPIYGIQSRAYTDPAGEHTSIGSMAREYAAMISERQPHGPIRIVGFSLGGFFALATVTELEKQGRNVSLVGLIDTPLAMLEKNAPQEIVLGELVVEIYDYFSSQLSLVPPIPADELSESVAVLVKKLKSTKKEEQSKIIMDWLMERGLEFGGATDNIAKKFLEVSLRHDDLIRSFQPKAVQSPVHYWSAIHSDLKNLHAQGDGRRLTAGSFTEQPLNGRHFELLQPPLVEQLAHQLNAALQEAESSVTVLAK